jgi:hypothetical protein
MNNTFLFEIKNEVYLNSDINQEKILWFIPEKKIQGK